MIDDHIILEIKNSVGTVILNRPEVNNAFDEAAIARLSAIFDDLAVRDDICAVVLQGRGKNFCAGGDLNWMKRAAGYTEEQNYEDALRLATMLKALYTLPQLTIACVQGAAMGGGLGLAACCDVVLADRDSVFSLSEVKLGLIPATIGPYVIRAMGPRQFRRYAQTGERFDAAKACAIGLVHEVADRPEDRDYILQTILKAVAANGPQAMRAAKRLNDDLTGVSLDGDVMKDTAQLIAKTRAGAEAREGIAAFLEKRKPSWLES